MEGGCLDRSILIKGADELAELAGGLEQLRRSLKENIANETALRQANQKLTTGIAHDRTHHVCSDPSVRRLR